MDFPPVTLTPYEAATQVLELMREELPPAEFHERVMAIRQAAGFDS